MLSFGRVMIMEIAGLNSSFKQLGRLAAVFFLLFSLQLHLLLALPLNSMVADHNHEKEIGKEAIVAKKLSLSIKLGGKDDEIKVVRRRGGAGAVGGAHGGVGEHGNAGDGGGGTTKSPDGQGGAVIPVYAAGAMNNNRYHHHHGSSSGTIGSSSCLVLILFTSFFFVYSI